MIGRICIKKISGERRSLVMNEVYVGRKVGGLRGSVLGNRFVVGKDGNRDEVIEKYRRWLWGEIKMMNFKVIDELVRILGLEVMFGEVRLVCWCKEDESCHSDVLVRCLEWMRGLNPRPPSHRPPRWKGDASQPRLPLVEQGSPYTPFAYQPLQPHSG